MSKLEPSLPGSPYGTLLLGRFAKVGSPESLACARVCIEFAYAIRRVREGHRPVVMALRKSVPTTITNDGFGVRVTFNNNYLEGTASEQVTSFRAVGYCYVEPTTIYIDDVQLEERVGRCRWRYFRFWWFPLRRGTARSLCCQPC